MEGLGYNWFRGWIGFPAILILKSSNTTKRVTSISLPAAAMAYVITETTRPEYCASWNANVIFSHIVPLLFPSLQRRDEEGGQRIKVSKTMGRIC